MKTHESPEIATVVVVAVLSALALAFVGNSGVIAVARSLYAYQASTIAYVPFNIQLAVSVG